MVLVNERNTAFTKRRRLGASNFQVSGGHASPYAAAAAAADGCKPYTAAYQSRQVIYDGPFRLNILRFLQDHGQPRGSFPSSSSSGSLQTAADGSGNGGLGDTGCSSPSTQVPIDTFGAFVTCRPYRSASTVAWSVPLGNPQVSSMGPYGHGQPLMLTVIEESVFGSRRAHCDSCRVVGWSHHPVSSRRFHFIIESTVSPTPPLARLSQTPGSPKDAAAAAAASAAAALAATTAGADSMPVARDVTGSTVNVKLENGGVGVKRCASCTVYLSLGSHHGMAGACPECGNQIPGSGLRGLKSAQELLDCQNHFLHGVVHANGFGHLLRVNGREGGSSMLTGRDLMDIWDRLCTMLRVRKISVEDVSKKRGMDLRLLSTVSTGSTWYGRWGYGFGRGSFGIDRQMHQSAVESLRGTPLDALRLDFERVDDDLVNIIRLYRQLSAQGVGLDGPRQLRTLGELLGYMMALKDIAPTSQQISGRGNSSRGSGNMNLQAVGGLGSCPPPSPSTPCRWSAKRVELATQVIVSVLDTSPKEWMSRQDVRDGARAHIGDTGLLDFVLKSLGNRVVGEKIVRREFNPKNKVLEYRLEPLNGAAPSSGASSDGSDGAVVVPSTPSEPATPSTPSTPTYGRIAGTGGMVPQAVSVSQDEVLRDILHVYKVVLENYKPLKANKQMEPLQCADVVNTSRIILDTKHLVKDYRGESQLGKPRMNPNRLDRSGAIDGPCPSSSSSLSCSSSDGEEGIVRVMCTAIIGDEDMARSRGPPPAELLVLPASATLHELKSAATAAFQDVYIALAGFQVSGVVGLGGVGDHEPLGWLADSNCELVVHGVGACSDSPYRFEGGNENWSVRCPCGTTDDDGERMVSCDSCEVWQHTKCNGYADNAPPPSQFFCTDCMASNFSNSATLDLSTATTGPAEGDLTMPAHEDHGVGESPLHDSPLIDSLANFTYDF